MKCITKTSLVTAGILAVGLVCAAFTHVPARPHAKVAIFDFHGVIFDVNKGKVARKHLGVFNILRYIFSGNSPLKMYKKALGLLCDMRNEQLVATKPNWPSMQGQPMPQAVVDWQLGTKSESEIRNEINAFIAAHPDYFASKLERKLVVRILQMMFNASIRLTYTEPLKEGVALVKWYKEAGYEVYALTNNDHVTMGILAKQYPDIFKLFDRIYYSADIKDMKPYPTCFTHVLRTNGITAQQCCFFDDQDDNIIAARGLGIKSMLCTPQRMKTLRKTLQAASPTTRSLDLLEQFA